MLYEGMLDHVDIKSNMSESIQEPSAVSSTTTETEEKVAQIQTFGYILCIFWACFWSVLVAISLWFFIFGCFDQITETYNSSQLKFSYESAEQTYVLLASSFFLYFYVKVLHQVDYLAGKPDIKKIWPILAGMISFLIFEWVHLREESSPRLTIMTWTVIAFGLILLLVRAIYFGDDEKGGCWIFFKPYAYPAVQSKDLDDPEATRQCCC